MTRKATTFRLDPTVQAGLALLSEVQGRPQNQLVNEAVREFVAARARSVSADLSATLERLKAYQTSDPTGGKSMETAMRAEAAVEHDPAQGERAEGDFAIGPASALMLDRLGR